MASSSMMFIPSFVKIGPFIKQLLSGNGHGEDMMMPYTYISFKKKEIKVVTFSSASADTGNIFNQEI
jgi:hypothetical protein